MNDDRELLELAAKAAGRVPDAIDENGCWFRCEHDEVIGAFTLWNPLKGDGDALRLAVKLRLAIDVMSESTDCDAPGHVHTNEDHEGDPYGATRRAIVRAAAEIGRAMP